MKQDFQRKKTVGSAMQREPMVMSEVFNESFQREESILYRYAQRKGLVGKTVEVRD